jgi:hypothetical protein
MSCFINAAATAENARWKSYTSTFKDYNHLKEMPSIYVNPASMENK